jgi:hypothetical protein
LRGSGTRTLRRRTAAVEPRRVSCDLKPTRAGR